MDYYGSGSIKGIYQTEEKAKVALADYVLKEETNTTYIDLFEMEVQQ